jgi:hypothetical protein
LNAMRMVDPFVGFRRGVSELPPRTNITPPSAL